MPFVAWAAFCMGGLLHGRPFALWRLRCALFAHSHFLYGATCP